MSEVVHMNMGDGGGDGDAFCTGTGRVMNSGFTGAYGGNSCVLFLFQGWAADTPVKYAFFILLTFCMAFGVEALTFGRRMFLAFLDDRDMTQHMRLVCKLPLAVLYGLHMLLAYWLMLLVMLYEYFFLTAIILGLSVGYLVFQILLPFVFRDRVTADPGHGSNTPCCSK